MLTTLQRKSKWQVNAKEMDICIVAEWCHAFRMVLYSLVFKAVAFTVFGIPATSYAIRVIMHQVRDRFLTDPKNLSSHGVASVVSITTPGSLSGGLGVGSSSRLVVSRGGVVGRGRGVSSSPIAPSSPLFLGGV